MGRHLVLTVHGIGEQKPGETVDAVVGAATTRFPELDRVPVTVERDLIQLAEAEFSPEPRNAVLFPVHLRRVRPVGGSEETLFAEVYWADRSPAPQGPFRTIFDLLRVVLGLGYLAMDNVENNRGWIAKGVVHLFTWLFYGLVAPLNAMLAIGSVLLLIELTPLDIVPSTTAAETRSLLQIPLIWLFFCHGFLTLGIGAFTLWKLAKTYLIRIFGRGMVGLGAVILILAVYGAWGGDFRVHDCETTACTDVAKMGFANLEAFIDYSIGLLGGAWGGVVFLAALSYLTVLLPKTQPPQPEQPGLRIIYPSVCTAMIVFWMLLSGAIWMGFVQLADQLAVMAGKPDGGLLQMFFSDRMKEALDTLAITFAGLVLLVIAVVVLVIVRVARKEALHTRPDLQSRLILNTALQVVFGVILLLIAIFILHGADVSRNGGGLEGECVIARAATSLDQAALCLTEATPYVMTVLLGLFVLIYNYSNFVAGALGVARDIVTYAVMARCRWRADAAARRANFTERNAIDARFRRVLYYGAEVLKPDRITVISHSQGTVIATQMLQNKWVKRKIAGLGRTLPDKEPPPVLLVTMGSPVTHLYRRYFADFFQVALSDMPARTTWHNIHRTDDFVGTMIDGVPGLAGNWEVPAGGHTGYFTDFHVWKRLWRDVGFTLF